MRSNIGPSGDLRMKKILVAYATWAGATHEIANKIADVLKEKDMDVEIVPAEKVNSIEPYQAIILGTSIHAGQTVKGFNQFLKKFHKDLAGRLFAPFIVCANMMEDNPKNIKETSGWANKTLEKYPDIKPAVLGLFGGALITEGEDFNKLNFFFKKMILSMRENLIKEYGKTDFRDWEKIIAWVNEIINQIEA
jgi:menaquinone-dependent protoporphyrinogen oxidase